MSFNQSFDFFGKMENNKTFYIFKSTSLEDNSEIISKLRKLENTPDFFEFYSNKDIKSIFKIFDEINLIYSDIYNTNNSKKIKSKIDQYISSLSNLYLISNLIYKNRIILEKAIYNTQKYMKNYFSYSNIDKNIQKKISNYVLKLLGLQNKKNKRFSLLLSHDNRNKLNNCKIENQNICIQNKKSHSKSAKLKIFDYSINNSSLIQEKTRDITNNTYLNNKISDDNILINLSTPKFQNIIIEENIMNNQQIIDEKMRDIYSKKESLNSNKIYDNKEEINKSLDKKESIYSFYTLASKSKFREESVKTIKRNSKFKEMNKEEKQNEIDLINVLNIKKCNTRNYSKFKSTEKKLNNLEKKGSDNEEDNNKDIKLIFSCTNVKTGKEEMLKNLLIFINDLYKKGAITLQEKLKLKQLIISKNEFLENIYFIYYNKDNDKLIKEIKKLTK